MTLVISADPVERYALMQKAVPQGATVEKFSCEDLRPVFDALQSPLLFGGDPLVWLDGCETLKKNDIEHLVSALKSKPLCVLGSSGKTPLAKHIPTVIDMTEEKPWEKEKRLSLHLISLAKQEGKFLSSDAIPLLFERLGTSLGALEQEIHKLTCYVGDRKTIERSDVLCMSAHQVTAPPWKTAEEIAWEGRGVFDVATFHPFIFSLRTQLQMGLKMATLAAGGVPPHELGPYFPKLRPQVLEKRRTQAIQKGELFFQKALATLFKVDLLIRSGTTDFEPLFDLLKCTCR
jgi:DNA polymerase-3 subunit delta